MAWIIEHNKVHHYYLNEDADPDYVQRNTEAIHEYDISLQAKYAIVAVQSVIWKWWYYASNTLKTMHADKPGAPSKAELHDAITMNTLVYKLNDPWYRGLAKDFAYIMAPNFLITFVGIPMLGGVFRWNFSLIPFCWITLINVLGAEAITNVHAFCTIVTNHAGSDLWSWNAPKAMPDTAEFYLRATMGSVAYPAGNDFVDYFHGYLNYQCEHHAFPSISPLHYQRLHPLFKKVCAKHGVPYIQENIVARTKKTADIIAGVAKHKHMVGNCVDQPEVWMCAKSEES
jgi:fatty acid desaturase